MSHHAKTIIAVVLGSTVLAAVAYYVFEVYLPTKAVQAAQAQHINALVRSTALSNPGYLSGVTDTSPSGVLDTFNGFSRNLAGIPPQTAPVDPAILQSRTSTLFR